MFLAIRFLANPYAISFDEAEQFLDAQDYELGYKDQPPLFSWIIKSLSFLMEPNAQSMALLTHVLIIFFLISFYYCLKEIWTSKESQLICYSLVFFFIYSLDFNRYLIHSILMTAIASMAFLFFLKILKHGKKLDYFIFGALLALGLLAKYNFFLFILVVFSASLFKKISRDKLFNWKIILSLISFFIVFSPHLNWLINTDFLPFKYASYRAGFGTLDKSFLAIAFEYLWQISLYTLVIFMFFKRNIDLDKKNELKELLKSILIWVLIIPAAVIIFFKTGAFFQRWLTGISFLIPISIFCFIKFPVPEKAFKQLCLVLISILYLVQANTFFNWVPNTNKIYVHIPYKAIYTKVKNTLLQDFKPNEVELYAFKEKSVFAGLKSFINNTEIIYFDKNTPIKHNDKTKLVVSNPTRFNKSKLAKAFSKRGLVYKEIHTVQKDYLHKQGAQYQLNIGLIQ